MKQRIVRAAALLVCAVLLCAAANFLAFTIDTPAMRQNVWQGCLMLGEQQGTPQAVGGFLSAQMDNFTGVLILKTAGYTGPESLLHKAFGGLRAEMPAAPGETGWEAFCRYGDRSPDGGLSYSRYWHGYTLPLRLLLCVLDVANLQMLLYFAQLVLMLIVLHGMGRRGLGRLIPGFFLSYFLMMPFALSVCLQYVPVSLLMLLGCVCVLRWDERIGRAVSMPAFYALLGLLTNFFDLLTFPLVSLGFPLILELALRMGRGEGGRRLFLHTALCGAAWALGYGGMWALKWLLNGLVFGWGVLHGVLAQMGLRASDNGGTLSRVAVLLQNADVMLAKKSYLLLAGLTGLATLAPLAQAVLRGRRVRMDARAAVLLLPAAAAFLWMLVMANHVSDHTYFTYRTLTVAVFAGFACLACLFAPKAGDAP